VVRKSRPELRGKNSGSCAPLFSEGLRAASGTSRDQLCQHESGDAAGRWHGGPKKIRNVIRRLFANVEPGFLVERAVGEQDGVALAVGIEHDWNRLLEHRATDEFQLPAILFEFGQRNLLILIEVAPQNYGRLAIDLASFLHVYSPSWTYPNPTMKLAENEMRNACQRSGRSTVVRPVRTRVHVIGAQRSAYASVRQGWCNSGCQYLNY